MEAMLRIDQRWKITEKGARQKVVGAQMRADKIGGRSPVRVSPLGTDYTA